MYQKTIVRYELNPKYKVDEPTDDFYDKWRFPCYLGVDEITTLSGMKTSLKPLPVKAMFISFSLLMTG